MGTSSPFGLVRDFVLRTMRRLPNHNPGKAGTTGSIPHYVNDIAGVADGFNVGGPYDRRLFPQSRVPVRQGCT